MAIDRNTKLTNKMNPEPAPPPKKNNKPTKNPDQTTNPDALSWALMGKMARNLKKLYNKSYATKNKKNLRMCATRLDQWFIFYVSFLSFLFNGVQLLDWLKL